MSARKEITIEQWLAELGQLEHSDGATKQEIMKMTGMSQSVTNNHLRRLFDEGRLIVGRKKKLALDGRMALVPAYKIKAAATKSPQRRKKQAG